MNDDLVDIAHNQQFATDCVQTGATEFTGRKPLHVSIPHQEYITRDSQMPDQFDYAKRGRDRDDRNTPLSVFDLDRDLIKSPHSSECTLLPFFARRWSREAGL